MALRPPGKCRGVSQHLRPLNEASHIPHADRIRSFRRAASKFSRSKDRHREAQRPRKAMRGLLRARLRFDNHRLSDAYSWSESPWLSPLERPPSVLCGAFSTIAKSKFSPLPTVSESVE